MCLRLMCCGISGSGGTACEGCGDSSGGVGGMLPGGGGGVRCGVGGGYAGSAG